MTSEPKVERTLCKLENVIAIKKGKSTAPKIMLAAHMDEVGLMVKTITKDGFLQFTKMGGIDDRILPAQKVTVFSRKGTFPGIIGSKPPHIQKEEERKKIISFRRAFHRHRSRKQGRCYGIRRCSRRSSRF